MAALIAELNRLCKKKHRSLEEFGPDTQLALITCISPKKEDAGRNMAALEVRLPCLHAKNCTGTLQSLSWLI